MFRLQWLPRAYPAGLTVALLIGLLALVDSAWAQGGSLALTKSADVTSYSAAGQVITYTYVVTNNGTEDFDFTDVEVDDDVLGLICSIPPTFAVGAVETCTATYTTTAADVAAARPITNEAFASGDYCGECFVASPTSSVTVGFAAQPSWTLTKTAFPTTYTEAGQTITYTYVLRNTGNTAISNILLTDDKIEGAVACASNSLAVGAETPCTATYVITEADIAFGSVTNVANASGAPAFGTLAPVSAQATVRLLAPGGSITIVKTAAGGDDSFGFTSTVPGAASFSLATSGGSASRSFPTLASGTYTFTEVNLPPDWRLATLSCVGDAGGTATIVDLANRTASVGLDTGETITCTFGNSIGDQTSQDIAAFLSHRLTFLAEGPDRTRFFRRIPESLWGNASGGGGSSQGPFAFTGSSNDSTMQMSVATSLLDMSQTYAQAGGAQLPMPSFDVWVEVHYSEFEDETSGRRSDGRFGVAYLGVDYLVTPTLLVGALGQFDWGEEESDGGSSANGVGVMAGPYLSARLAPNLFFTTRAAYGGSENSIDPFGLYEDDFSTDRWLASAELTGNWNFGSWRVTPSAGVTYLQEDQHSYTDSRGVFIPDQVVSLGQISFGPEIAYRFAANDRFTLEPHLSVTGLWEFDGDNGIIAGLVASDDDLRAKVKAGVLAQSVGGASLRVVGTFDGIGGGGYDAFGAQAWLSVPLR